MLLRVMMRRNLPLVISLSNLLFKLRMQSYAVDGIRAQSANKQKIYIEETA